MNVFFMMIQSVLIMMTLNLFDIESSNSVSLLMVFIITLGQNLNLKNYIINPDLQSFNPWINSLIYLIFLTLVLFMTLLRLSLTNWFPWRNLFNHKPPIEKPEPKMIYDPKGEPHSVFFFPYLSLRINTVWKSC